MNLVCGLDICPCEKVPRCKRAENCKECIDHHASHKAKPQSWCMRPENAEKLSLLKNVQKAQDR